MSSQPMLKLGAIALHTISAALMATGYKSLTSLPEMNALIMGQTGGRLQFLTILALSVAWLTMAISVILDVFPSLVALRMLKRGIFMIAMPVEVVVSTVYWPLVLFAPSLIIQAASPTEPSSSPEALFRLPLSIDLFLHLVPGVALLLDFTLFETKFSHSETTYYAPLVVACSTVGYAWWVEYCAQLNGTFPYPFLTQSPYEIRLAIYSGAGVLALLSFLFINHFHAKNAP